MGGRATQSQNKANFVFLSPGGLQPENISHINISKLAECDFLNKSNLLFLLLSLVSPLEESTAAPKMVPRQDDPSQEIVHGGGQMWGSRRGKGGGGTGRLINHL